MFQNLFFYIITGCKQEILNLLEINMTLNFFNNYLRLSKIIFIYDFQKCYSENVCVSFCYNVKFANGF